MGLRAAIRARPLLPPLALRARTVPAWRRAFRDSLLRTGPDLVRAPCPCHVTEATRPGSPTTFRDEPIHLTQRNHR